MCVRVSIGCVCFTIGFEIRVTCVDRHHLNQSMKYMVNMSDAALIFDIFKVCPESACESVSFATLCAEERSRALASNASHRRTYTHSCNGSKERLAFAMDIHRYFCGTMQIPMLELFRLTEANHYLIKSPWKGGGGGGGAVHSSALSVLCVWLAFLSMPLTFDFRFSQSSHSRGVGRQFIGKRR